MRSDITGFFQGGAGFFMKKTITGKKSHITRCTSKLTLFALTGQAFL
jgi:hypothetical protein